MRVLHCLWSGHVGGAERALYQLVSAQRAGDIEPGVLFGRGGGPYAERLRALDVPVTELGLSGGADPRVLIRGSRAMAGWDVLHFHSAEPGLMAAGLRTGRSALRVYTNRGGTAPEHFDRFRQRVRHRAVGRLLRRFDALSANTVHAAAVAARRYGIAESRFAVTPNGLDFGLLQPDAPVERVREALGIGPGRMVAGTVAVLRPLKRVERLLEAAARMSDPDVVVVVVGDGPDRPRLEERAERLGLSDRVRFTGMLDSVASHVAAMDVFVLTSGDRESFGNAVVEAMALGVPSVVFADAPGVREHVRDGETGVVVEDVAGLAAAIESLGRDRDRASAMARAGRNDVRERYSLQAMVRSYAGLYASAAEAGRNR